MKFIPILFSTQMVQAIIEGRKTMTRRVMKPQPYPVTSHGASVENYYEWDASKNVSDLPFQEWVKNCHYGKVGDVLWVREKTCFVMIEHAHVLLEGFREKRQTIYGTDFHEDWMRYAKEKYHYKWQPSLFMPKAACRIFLKITEIRVERLQDISEEDAKKEGVEFTIADKEKFGCRAQGMKLYRNYERKDNSLTTHPFKGFETST